MSITAQSTRSEDVLSRKLDTCVADIMIKTGGGFATGALFSIFLLKRKAWPLILGVGIGAGLGLANCQHQLNIHPVETKK